MFRFNTETQTTLYDAEATGGGLDQCLDCTSEVLVLREYLTRVRGMAADDAGLPRAIKDLSATLTRLCSRSGRGVDGHSTHGC